MDPSANLDPASSIQGQNLPQGDINATNAVEDTIKGQINIPRYSGHAQNTSYEGDKGLQTELFSIHSWIRRIETIKGAANWSDKVTAQHAKLALLPNQPAGIWLDVNAENAETEQWPTLKPLLIKEFSTYVDASEKVDILRSFKQKTIETVGAYANRVRFNYQKFLDGLESEWDPNASAAEVTVRKEIVQKVTDYHLSSFVCMGLHDNILQDVTKADCDSLDAMITTAKNSERANNQSKKRHTISAVDTSFNNPAPMPTPAPAPAYDDEVVAFVRAQMKRQGGAGRGSGAQRNGKGKRPTCFYCRKIGHYANECRSREADRKQGRFRNCITDSPMSKEDFLRMVANRNPGAASAIGTVSDEELFNNMAAFSKN